MNYRTPLARARGLGTARDGVTHWWRQRLSSIALIPLSLWLACAVAAWPHASHGQFVAWVGSPWNLVLLLATVLVAFVHAALGIQVVVEDYVHIGWFKFLALIVTQLSLGLLVLAAIISVLRIAFAV